jgi:putative oxidoreductase
MEKLRQWIDWAEAHPKVWLDCVRIYLGLGLFIRGVFIISNTRAEFVSVLLEQLQFPWIITVFLLHYIALAHLIGGLMLTVGLLTRIAAWVQVPILAGAIVMHRGEGLMSGGQSLELSGLVLFLLVTFAISGAGPVSVDNGMPKLRAEPHADDAHPGAV